jgi:hypothetical protein
MSEREEKQKKERKTKRDTNPMRQGSSAETHGKEFFDKIARRGDAQITNKPRKKGHGTQGR